MDFDEYQSRTSDTIVESENASILLARMALGLTGESGEVAEKVKKVLRDNNGVLTPEIAQQIAAELGDVLWYLARLSDMCGVNLTDIAKQNLDKLKSRQLRDQIKGSGDDR